MYYIVISSIFILIHSILININKKRVRFAPDTDFGYRGKFPTRTIRELSF